MVKEEFCPPCAVIPLALIGAGTTGSSNTFKKKSKIKTIVFSIGMTISILTFLISVYYFMKCCRKN